MTRIVKSDNGGNIYAIDNVKFGIQVDWTEVFNILKNSSQIYILTYSISNYNFIAELSKQPNVKIIDIILCKEWRKSFETKAILENMSSKIKVRLVKDIHTKIILGAPSFVYLGSENIDCPDDKWFQNTTYFLDKMVYNHYLKVACDLWEGKRQYNIQKTNRKYVDFYDPGNNSFIKRNYSSIIPIDAIYNNLIIKLSDQLNWNQKFNRYCDRSIIITTYTIPDLYYAERILKKILAQGNDVTIIANDISIDRLHYLKELFPNNFYYHTRPNIHAKMVLVNNNDNKIRNIKQGKQIVWLSSQNFGTSGWMENTICVKSKNSKDSKVYQFYKKNLYNFLKLGTDI